MRRHSPRRGDCVPGVDALEIRDLLSGLVGPSGPAVSAPACPQPSAWLGPDLAAAPARDGGHHPDGPPTSTPAGADSPAASPAPAVALTAAMTAPTVNFAAVAPTPVARRFVAPADRPVAFAQNAAHPAPAPGVTPAANPNANLAVTVASEAVAPAPSASAAVARDPQGDAPAPSESAPSIQGPAPVAASAVAPTLQLSPGAASAPAPRRPNPPAAGRVLIRAQDAPEAAAEPAKAPPPKGAGPISAWFPFEPEALEQAIEGLLDRFEGLVDAPAGPDRGTSPLVPVATALVVLEAARRWRNRRVDAPAVRGCRARRALLGGFF